MKSRWLPILVVLASGCQKTAAPAESFDKPADRSNAAPPVAPVAPVGDKGYADDIAKLCDALTLSGAADSPDRTFIVANWLSENLKTRESREFLVRIQPLAAEPKAQALVAEARRVGLPDCALAEVWRQPPPAP